MLITSDGDGLEIHGQSGDSQELFVIATSLLPQWLELFAKKNSDYGSGSSFELGVRGQYSDIYRKVIKLKRAMWDGEALQFEGLDEILSDLIGHLFLTKYMIRVKEEGDRAFVYNEEDAAVDAFLRMVGDPRKAFDLSRQLIEPFGRKIRDRVEKILNDDLAEMHNMYRKQVAGFEASRTNEEKQQELMADRLERGETLRLEALAMEAEGGFDDSRFAESDAAQNGMTGDRYPGGSVTKVGPTRIVTEQQDGVTRYYHEPFPGADRTPLTLVPKELIDRLQKDHYVLSQEQAAGLNKLAEWGFNQ